VKGAPGCRPTCGFGHVPARALRAAGTGGH
jgi:hypothetical protein